MFSPLAPWRKGCILCTPEQKQRQTLVFKWDIGVTFLLQGQPPKFLNWGDGHGNTSAFLCPSVCPCSVGFLNPVSFFCRRIGLLTEGPGSQAELALVHSEGTGVCVLSGSVPGSQPPRAASWLLVSCVLGSEFC